MPPIPIINLSVSTGVMFSRMQVVESREMPPLPVSIIKFKVSGKPTSCARITTTPPVKVVNGTWVINFAELFDFFWAITVQQHTRTRMKLKRVLRAASIGQTIFLSFAVFMIQKRSLVLV
jgi:hypothetical protein